MTDINELIDKVRKSVEDEVEALLSAAVSKVKVFETEYARSVAAEEKKCRELVEEGRLELTRRYSADELSEKKKLLLSVKNRLLDLVFEKLRDKLASLPAEKYKKLFKNHLSVSGTLSGLTGVRARIGRSETVLDTYFFESLEGVKIAFEGQDKSFEKGFVLETDEFVISVTLDDIVRSIREKTSQEVVQVHFSGLFEGTE